MSQTDAYGRPIVIPAEAVKDECQRRIIARVGARDLTDCLTKQLNATMRAIELTRVGLVRSLTAEETAESAALQALADAIKALRARSNVLEAMDPIPLDYRDDRYWTD